jgi:hypothetical protein
MSESSQPAVPPSPDALIAMQQRGTEAAASAAEAEEQRRSAKLDQLLAQIESLDICAWESQQLALVLVHRLEKFHDAVVAELNGDENAPHNQIARWAIDADRLCRCRRMLEEVDLE